ncbi:MAG TPA: phosphoribosylformylglycinamidine synthase subunit PurS, partial [Anaerolineales bacterium]|nr:phosphoribosylformylglycinamidine synthase subunit PurS [Anaerolineales bacterium]
MALKLLSDPVTQNVSWDELPAPLTPPEPDSVILEVSLRPGVTDPVAAEIVRSAYELGINGVHRAATGQRFILTGLDETQIPLLANQLLANNVIQHWKIGSIEPSFPEEVESSGQVETIAIRTLSDDELLALSKDRRAALDLAEMQAIRAYCQKESRDLTDVEFETIAQTWSEHCVHKTFKAKVTFDDGKVIDSIIK